MKKTVLAFVVALLICANLALPAFATETVVTHSGTCGDNLRWSLDSNGILTIEGSGEMDDYDFYVIHYGYKSEKLAPWDKLQASVKELNFKYEPTRISDCAFAKLHELTTITIPDTVEEIGIEAFGYCSNLSEITIPASVSVIKEYAFKGCNNLKHVYFAGSEEEWDAIDIAVYGNKLLKKVEIHFNCNQPIELIAKEDRP